MEYLTLNNGNKMPMDGIGVFLLKPEEAEASVLSALNDGIRLIDTANAYMNEKAVGRAIKRSGVRREEIFLVTKLWPTVYEDENAIDETLKRLDTDYIDLLFLHQPTGNWRKGQIRDLSHASPHPFFLAFPVDRPFLSVQHFRHGYMVARRICTL